MTVTATMAHSESFMDDPQSSTVFEAKGLWKEAFKSLYEFYQHKALCDVEIEVFDFIHHDGLIVVATFTSQCNSALKF